MGHFGLSYIGLAYMVMLLVPNFLWTRHKPIGYDPTNENKTLLFFERIGQVLCTVALLFFKDTNPHGREIWLIWLVASILLMILYLFYWIRYFLRGCTLRDFYKPFLSIPAPGATLPVLAIFLLGIYGQLIWLIAASVILAFGHIGIHWQNIKYHHNR